MHIKIASIMLVASVLGLSAIVPTIAYAQQQDLISAIAGGFESIKVEQSPTEIVITITKEGGAAEPPAPGENVTGNVTTPTEPIIIVPDPGGEGNGTVIVPEPPTGNETIPPGGNVTEPGEPPVIIVDPGNNDSIVVEPPTNVTQIDNGTVIIAPPDQPVTETPGNVTIIDPPAVNATEPGIPEECGCPIGVEGAPPDIQPQPPAVTDNETIIVEQPDINVPAPPEPEPAPAPEDGGDGGNGDGNGDGGNGGGGGG